MMFRPIHLAVLVILGAIILLNGPYWHAETQERVVVATKTAYKTEAYALQMIELVFSPSRDFTYRAVPVSDWGEMKDGIFIPYGGYRGILYERIPITILDSFIPGEFFLQKIPWMFGLSIIIITLVGADASKEITSTFVNKGEEKHD